MTSPADTVSRLEKRWDELRARFGAISKMRPGSLVEPLDLEAVEEAPYPHRDVRRPVQSGWRS
jgi:hypothetical protein